MGCSSESQVGRLLGKALEERAGKSWEHQPMQSPPSPPPRQYWVPAALPAGLTTGGMCLVCNTAMKSNLYWAENTELIKGSQVVPKGR